MPVIRKQLKPSDVYPDDIRYDEGTDTVQSLINGVWTDNPDADPRNQTTFPPRITSDPACDAAESVKEALKGQIDDVVVAIDNASTLFTIAGIILSIFTFGAYAIFIGLALGLSDTMVGLGSSAITAALTEAVYDTFKCILFCHMTSSGRLVEGDLDAVKADVTSQIGGIGAVILNAMLSLAGEGGINNLASLGMSTGDCSACGCQWCYYFDFTLSDGGWLINTDGFTFGRYTAGVGFQQNVSYNPVDAIEIYITFAESIITSVTLYADPTFNGASPRTILYKGDFASPSVTFNGSWDQHEFVLSETLTQVSFDIDPQAGGASQWTGAIIAAKITGFGDNPFGADNCP